MAKLGILGLIVVGVYVMCLPLYYISRTINLGEKDKEIAGLRATAAERDVIVEKLRTRLGGNDAAIAKLSAEQQTTQKELNAAQQETVRLKALNGQVEAKLTALQSQLDVLNRASPQSKVKDVVAEPETMESTCPTCGGDYKHQLVLCERKAGVGCGGKGYRPCFKCQGQAVIMCTNCQGTGKITIADGAGKGTHLEGCTICGEDKHRGGKGKVDCPSCTTLYVREPMHLDLPPYISQEDPLNGTRPENSTIVVNGCRMVVSEHYRPWIKVVGNIICPRCNGDGKYKIAKLCPDCDQGKVKPKS